MVDDNGVLTGAVPLPELVRAAEADPVSQLVEAAMPTVAPEADLPEVARLMTDYNIAAMAVVDDDGRPVGVIAVDDVLELLLPEEWRRRAGVARS